MALINCPECNKEISDKALACPNCGFIINKNNKEPNEQSNEYNQTIFDNGRRQSVFDIKLIKRFSLFAPITIIITRLFITIINFIFSATGSSIPAQYNTIIEIISSILIALSMLLVFYAPVKQVINKNDIKLFLTAIIPILLPHFSGVFLDFINKHFYPRYQVLLLCNFLFTIISIVLSYVLTYIFSNYILKTELRKNTILSKNEHTNNYKNSGWKKVIIIVSTVLIVLIASMLIFDVIMDATHKNLDELTEEGKKIQNQIEENREQIEENQRKIEEAESKRDEYYANH